MTPLDRAAELKALRKKATAGEWVADDSHIDTAVNTLGGIHVALCSLSVGKAQCDDTAAFIAAAANHVVEVCEALEAAERRNADLVELVEAAYDEGYKAHSNNIGLERGQWPHTFPSSDVKHELARIMGTEAR